MPLSEGHKEIVAELYASTKMTVDDLPYTAEFDRLHSYFPDPDRPVMTTILSLGMSRLMFFKLCWRAPRIWMRS